MTKKQQPIMPVELKELVQIIYKVLELIYQQNKDFGQNSKLFGYNL